MKFQLRKLAEQVIVITGATSGIGLATARRAAAAGASLVLAARNDDALRRIEHELHGQGRNAITVPTDVADPRQVDRLAQAAIESYGRFDTWINNAGVSIYGPIEQVPLDEHRQLFEINFWGVVHGSLAALRHLRERGGVLINIGSELSDVAAPLQGMYSASKHAVKGFTDALRLEVEKDHAPVSITLVKPAAVDSMLVEHAKNYLEQEPKLPPPVYSPDVAAEAILSAAEHPKRDIFVGGAAAVASAAARVAPRLMDSFLKRFMFDQQKSGEPPSDRDDNSLFRPATDGRERSGKVKKVRERSNYTAATTKAASGKPRRKAPAARRARVAEPVE